jgi:hypothetical protein
VQKLALLWKVAIGLLLVASVASAAWAGPQLVAKALAQCSSSSVCFGGTNSRSGPAFAAVSASGSSALRASGYASGVVGLASGGTGISAASTSGIGAEGISNEANGIVGKTESSNAAVYGVATSGAGVLGNSARGLAAVTATGLQGFVGQGQFVAQAQTGRGPALELHNSQGKTVFSVDGSGNMYYAGTKFYCSCSPALGPPKQTSQKVDRTVVLIGRSTLAGGVARVPLDPRIRSGLDPARPYQVFVSGSGSTDAWLYVERRTAEAFTVRVHGGDAALQSSPFRYRIVARVTGDASRLNSGMPL